MTILVPAQMYWGDHMDGDRVRWWVPLVWLVFVALVAVAAIALLRAWPAGGRPTPPPVTGSARAVLAERYARGEITTDELRERSAALDELERSGS